MAAEPQEGREAKGSLVIYQHKESEELTSLTWQLGPRTHWGREGGGGRGMVVRPARKRETPGRAWRCRTGIYD